MKINLEKQNTSAQAVTKVCYNEATRNLDYRIECEDLTDLKECVKIINSYNEFDWKTINQALVDYANVKVYYNKDNPNNGQNLFDFKIGREGSPVMYISFNDHRSSYEENGEVKAYTKEMFKKDMKALAGITHADECDFEDGWMCECRLWWD